MGAQSIIIKSVTYLQLDTPPLDTQTPLFLHGEGLHDKNPVE